MGIPHDLHTSRWLAINYDDVVKPTCLDEPNCYMANNVLDLQDLPDSLRHLFVKSNCCHNKCLCGTIWGGWISNLWKRWTTHIQTTCVCKHVQQFMKLILLASIVPKRARGVDHYFNYHSTFVSTSALCQRLERKSLIFPTLFLSQTCDHCNFMGTNICSLNYIFPIVIYMKILFWVILIFKFKRWTPI